MKKIKKVWHKPENKIAAAEYLRYMAKQGYFLQKVGFIFATFIKDKPIDTYYAIDYYSTPNNETNLDYLENCKAAGWDYIDSTVNIYYFKSSNNSSLPPLHTDISIEKEIEKEIYGSVGRFIITLIALIVIFAIILFNIYRAGFDKVVNDVFFNYKGLLTIVLPALMLIFMSIRNSILAKRYKGNTGMQYKLSVDFDNVMFIPMILFIFALSAMVF